MDLPILATVGQLNESHTHVKRHYECAFAGGIAVTDLHIHDSLISLSTFRPIRRLRHTLDGFNQGHALWNA